MNNATKVNEGICECLDHLDDLIQYARGVKNLSTTNSEAICWREMIEQCTALYDNLMQIEAA